MRYFKNVFSLFSTILLLAACAVSDGLPQLQHWPQWQSADTRWFKLESLDAEGKVRQTSLLAVQPEADSLRFVQTDALGAPLSRQILTRQGWRNDGFAPPNPAARRLFAAILPLLAVDGGQIYPPQNPTPWRSQVSDGMMSVAFPDGTHWRVTPLE
ncbi:MAG: hypothetical protein Q4G28_05105 [Neisseria sp.]|nr:hypothetical protein [Neisseria sp.]